MLVARLLFNDVALRKLGQRGIRPSEIEQLPRNDAVGMRNPRPRVSGSRLMVGATDGGRVLTAMVEPESMDDAIWHVRTAWDASARERSAYHWAS